MSDIMNVLEKEKLEKKLARRMGPSKAMEFVAELERMDKRELEGKLLGYAKHAQAIQNTKNADKALQDARDLVSGLSAPYREQLTANKELQRLVSLLISEKFGDEDMDLKVSQDDAEESED